MKIEKSVYYYLENKYIVLLHRRSNDFSVTLKMWEVNSWSYDEDNNTQPIWDEATFCFELYRRADGKTFYNFGSEPVYSEPEVFAEGIKLAAHVADLFILQERPKEYIPQSDWVYDPEKKKIRLVPIDFKGDDLYTLFPSFYDEDYMVE